MRPVDLAREHGLSAQAVRNYEQQGCVPVAERTRSGYRIYTEVHAAALRAYLALVTAHGYATAGRIMRALHEGDVDEALATIDRGHGQSLQDRATLGAVREAVDHLVAGGVAAPARSADPRPLTIGELARRLGVTPATLRNWEVAGVVLPTRGAGTGYRLFHADDVRDAELAHLLRRGGYPLRRIATVVQQLRTAEDTEALVRALDDWRRKLTARGIAMLDAAAHLSRYLGLLGVQHTQRSR